MPSIILGSISSIESYRDEITKYDPSLEQQWVEALAANKVSGDDDPDDDVKAARLSALTKSRTISGRRECMVTTTSDPLAALLEICGTNGVVDNHFASGTGPVWVEGDYTALVSMIAEKYSCPIGRPSDWTDQTNSGE